MRIEMEKQKVGEIENTAVTHTHTHLGAGHSQVWRLDGEDIAAGASYSLASAK